MFFPPNQWEFKCLVHINIKQNIRQRGLLANSVSADFITYDQRYRGRNENGGQTPIVFCNFTHAAMKFIIHSIRVYLGLASAFCLAFVKSFSSQ